MSACDKCKRDSFGLWQVFRTTTGEIVPHAPYAQFDKLFYCIGYFGDAWSDDVQKLSDARIEAKRLISERGNKQSTLDALVKAVETATAAEIVRLKGMLFGDLSEHDKLMSQINKQGGK